MIASMLTACGSSNGGSNSSNGGSGSSESTYSKDFQYTTSSDGKVFNIYCWNEEFQSRLISHYKDYEEVDATTGKIGDVTVNWIITPSDENAYQNKLDTDLLAQADTAADDRIDLFLVEADYALKYVDTEYTVPVEQLGLTSDDVANQYQYTKDVVTDSYGQLKGVSWQGCPGLLFYNREAAIDIFGTDDADTIQSYVSDWDTFTATAQTVVDAGYTMTSTVNDTYRVYSNNVTSKWVTDDDVINVDANIKKWVDDSKTLLDMGATTTAELWTDDWKLGFYPEGKVFCYFGPAWMINFSMAASEEGSIANLGGWGAVEGPQGFYWGGTWICAANYTDNADLIKDIMYTLTCDEETMIDIVKEDDDFVNNQPAMEAMAQLPTESDDDSVDTYSSAVLGGINPLSLYAAGATKIDLSNQTEYDQGITESFQSAMKDYFDGNCTYDEALDAFYTAVIEKYPNLKRPE
jgi:hypothetical protein